MNTARRLTLVTATTVTLIASFGGFRIYSAERDLAVLYAAAEHGDPHIHSRMGLYFYRGDPFPQDFSKAMKWWRRAADQGNAEAQFNVGHMYWFGEGVPRDAVQSYMWANLAAKQNYAKAIKSIPDLENAMTPEQIGEAKRRANDWRPKPEANSASEELER